MSVDAHFEMLWNHRSGLKLITCLLTAEPVLQSRLCAIIKSLLGFSHASSPCAGEAGDGPTLWSIYSEVSRHRLNWLPWYLVQIIRFPKGWIFTTSVISWVFNHAPPSSQNFLIQHFSFLGTVSFYKRSPLSFSCALKWKDRTDQRYHLIYSDQELFHCAYGMRGV